MTSILLVEDDDGVRQLIKDILTRAGYELDECNNGRKAFSMYKTKRADLVITDLIMPDKEGLELIRELIAYDPEAKIIAMSGGGRLDPGDYLRTAHVFGACRTLYKPFGNAEFLATVREALG